MSKVRVAILGTGGIAAKHTRAAAERDDVEFVGLCDINEETVNRFRDSQFGDAATPPKTFTDAAAMYESTKPDAVVINTPHTLHFDHCSQALEYGCHVLVEKPMVTSLAHAEALDKKVADSGKILCVGYNTACSARLYTLREYVRNETYGKLKVISLDITQRWYHLVQNTWRMQPELSGGGMIYDSGAHVLNSLVWTVESDVEKVHAWVDNLDVPVDINGTINIRFTNGVLATVAVGGEVPSGCHGTFMFENARVTIDPWSATWMKLVTTDGEVEPEMLGDDASPFDNFIDSVQGNATPRTSPRNGIVQSQLMDAIYKSAASGQPERP